MRRITPYLLAIILTGCGGAADEPSINEMPDAGTVTPEHAFWSAEEPGALIGMIGADVTTVDETTCYVYGDATVIDHTGGDQPGFILIREGDNCSSNELGSDKRVDTEAFEFFMAYADGYLFLDSGTGPDARELTVVDIVSDKQLYDGPYIHQVNRAEEALYFFWVPTDLIPEEVCERAAEWEADGMGVGYEEQYALDARSGALLPLGALTCSMRQ